LCIYVQGRGLMKRLGGFFAFVACTIAVLGLTGCDPEVAGDDLAAVIGHHAGAVKIDPDKVAQDWSGVSSSDISNAIDKLHDSEIWQEIGKQLSEADENTDGPVRDAMVETACDAVQNDYTDAQVGQDLTTNLEDTVHPPEAQLLGTVDKMVDTLSNGYQDGESTDQAVIALGCETNSAYGDLKS
jgi:hypothetical protein